MGALISRDSSLQLTVSSIPPAPSSSVLLSSLPSAVVRDAFDALWTALELQHTTRTDRPSFNHFRRGLQAALMAEWGELGVTTRRAVWEEWRETLALVVEGGLCEAGELVRRLSPFSASSCFSPPKPTPAGRFLASLPSLHLPHYLSLDHDGSATAQAHRPRRLRLPLRSES